MIKGKPRFHLTRQFDDGSEEEAQIVSVLSLPGETHLGRRGFLGAGVTAAAALAALTGFRAGPQRSGTETVKILARSEPAGGAALPPDTSADPAALPQQLGDYQVPDGWFFGQASDEPGCGFTVIDDASARFWSEFRRLGGIDAVGYPISRRFLWNGFVSQAFQKMIFQWLADERRADIVNVLDVMHERGLDGWLLTVRQTPPIADWAADAGRPWPQVVQAHQALLTDPEIRSTYLGAPDPLAVYGLPMAPIQDLGNVLVLRAQRAVIQKWLVDTPWARAGQVTVANSGDLAKESGLLPAEALTPDVCPPTASTIQPTGGTQTETMTLPCDGRPVPAGWICTCNCVPSSSGTARPIATPLPPTATPRPPTATPVRPTATPVPPAPTQRPSQSGGSGGGTTVCTCNRVCTCVPVYR